MALTEIGVSTGISAWAAEQVVNRFPQKRVKPDVSGSRPAKSGFYPEWPLNGQRPILCQIRQKRLTLAGLPDRDSGRLRSQQSSGDALAAIRNWTHIPKADPPLGRTGSGDLESVAGYTLCRSSWACAGVR
ncbi:hypothetical protein LJR220_005296 [Bradyrhizobium sp. LjRoot220]|uniref:hypothetical protein n=1 Tax=Bradyrhizobium sp. LjRoot220 TaxID=3342284 RepID=UPI003ECF991F